MPTEAGQIQPKKWRTVLRSAIFDWADEGLALSVL